MKWVLLSLANCNVSFKKVRLKLLIVNNHPPSKLELEALIENEIFNHLKVNWQVKLLHRELTQLPILSWYGAIRDSVDDGDAVFLNGDDDLFTQDSIQTRYDFLANEEADLLISDFYGGLTFLPNGHVHLSQKFHTVAIPNVSNAKWKTTAFISAQVFVKNELFKDAIDMSFRWAKGQNFASFDQTSLMIPYYLPVALSFLGGKTVYSDGLFVLRGTSLADRSKSPFGVPGWNSGFISFFALDVLRRKDLNNQKELNPCRLELTQYINAWFFTFWLDKRINKSLLKTVRSRVPLEIMPEMRLKSILKVLKNFLQLNGIRVKIDLLFGKNIKSVEELLREV